MPAAKPSYPRLRRGHPLAQGLNGAWACYEGSGLTLNDLSGNDNTGTLASAGVTWAGGQAGWALNFDGVDTHNVSIPESPSLDIGGGPTSHVTVAAWVYPTTTNDGGIYDKTHGGSTNSQYLLFIETSLWKWRVVASGQHDVVSTGAPTLNAWTHVAGTYHSGTDVQNLYLNGVLNATATGSAAIDAPISGVTLIGELGSNAFPFTGMIDAVMFYSRDLSAAEIAALYADSFAMFRRKRSVVKAAAVAGKVPYDLPHSPQHQTVLAM